MEEGEPESYEHIEFIPESITPEALQRRFKQKTATLLDGKVKYERRLAYFTEQ
jgi:hypothetical protein